MPLFNNTNLLWHWAWSLFSVRLSYRASCQPVFIKAWHQAQTITFVFWLSPSSCVCSALYYTQTVAWGIDDLMSIFLLNPFFSSWFHFSLEWMIHIKIFNLCFKSHYFTKYTLTDRIIWSSRKASGCYHNYNTPLCLLRFTAKSASVVKQITHAACADCL